MKISSEQEMLAFGEEFAKSLKERQNPPFTIELIGDVGVGKTTFTRGFAKALGVKEPVTSPSFTISKTYALPNHQTLVHYDFYRLLDPGLMADNLAEQLNNPDSIVLIEWGAEVENLLPENTIKITISYNDDNTREINIQ